MGVSMESAVDESGAAETSGPTGGSVLVEVSGPAELTGGLRTSAAASEPLDSRLRGA